MTRDEIKTLREAVSSFSVCPSPYSADNLLKLMAPHRKNHTIQQLIDEVLEYKFLVGPISDHRRSLLDS